MKTSVKLISGNANPTLAREVSAYLNIPLTPCMIGKFADGEIHVQIEESVRGQHVFVLQSLSLPVNDHIMELLVLVDALKRASAKTITAVLPYYAYARQDRQARPRTPISAKLLADILAAAGVDRVVAMDLHATQIQGFFSIPFDHLHASPVLVSAMRTVVGDGRAVIVSPDAGGMERARYFGRKLGLGLAVLDKRRPRPNVAGVMHIIGDVEGMDALIVDDMIDTAGTLSSAANALKDAGAKRVFAFATHGLFNGAAIERIEKSELSQVYVTNTVPPRETSENVTWLSVGTTIGEAISRINGDASISSLWE